MYFEKIQIPFRSAKKIAQFTWNRICICYNILSVFLL